MNNIRMQEMSSGSALGHEDHELQHCHDSNVCVRCRTSLFQRKRVQKENILLKPLPRERYSRVEGGLIYFACWVHSQRTIQQQGIIVAPAVNNNVCVWCQRSLGQTRSHSISEGPERTTITETIYPSEIPPGGLVWYACWVAAHRNVERTAKIEDNQQNPGPSDVHQETMCAWCRMSLHRRQTYVASGTLRDEVAARIYSNELPEHALICSNSNCWTHAQENIRMEHEVLQQFDIQPSSASITLDGFTHTTQTSAHCFVPACNNVEHNRVLEYL